MNERIEKLLIEAHKQTNGGIYSGHLSEWTEKFAELIIQEAIAVVNKRYMGDNNREDMEVRRCVEDLTKHFGVE